MSMVHIASEHNKSFITPLDEQQIQPNAVDVRLEKVLKVRSDLFVLSEDEKQHRGCDPVECDEQGWFYLEPGVYEVICEGEIKIGEGCAGYFIQRSSCLRNGVTMQSSLFDSSFHGKPGGVMIVRCGPVKIKKGTRIAQFIQWEAEALNQYNGSYGFGTSHEQKYI